ncbi:penicillin-binding protein 1C [Sphingomonas canadensis]|uniref:peptidoglycan glycosyltransferase n=1 Tax=Sphingomonas canadensis TaxID=1219257 RepID=A0ABW3H0D7_9SPHN|nr:penicillin-binding protein 1C [Sphingomonas canadensis]MCW3835154.1 penicillin-binding protein 1C [Sphingomonas canadensis]
MTLDRVRAYLTAGFTRIRAGAVALAGRMRPAAARGWAALSGWARARWDEIGEHGWGSLFTRRRIAWAAGVAALAGVIAVDLATLPPELPGYAQARAGWAPSESWLYDRDGRLIDSSRIDYRVRRLAWTPLAEVAPAARQTIVAAEDRRFQEHGGVDWWAIGGALRDWWSGRRTRGASTLSMQVAGFLTPDLSAPGSRNWLDKLRQMRAGWAIEGRWSKDQILEAYLNLAGFRGEAQGIGAAALGLFGKTPAALTRDDALLLAALLPDPGAKADGIARRACAMAQEKDCTRFAAQAATMLGPARSLALDPGLAPHLADKLLDKPGMRVTTTLDARIQRLAIEALRRQLMGLGGTRARDGAVLVADNATGEVLAYVGGIGGNSTAPAVDAVSRNYRQAGSTLKPFLYAQAIEKGYLTAASILDDSPVQLDTDSGLYVPQNYDRAFKGPVSARMALAGSLNVPAVRTLLLVGVEAFRDRLFDTGYAGLTEAGDYYGYSLALGSAEVTLFEQVAAFRSLARGGRWGPLKLVPGDPSAPVRRTTTPEAAWIVADILSDPNARAGTFGVDSALRLPFWAAAKTGTSKAMRDNWCIGFSDRFTVGVWIGNLEGDPMRAVSGTSGAAPVWRDMMIALHSGSASREPAPPPGVEMRQIRFAGGLEQPRREYFLKGTGLTEVAVAPPESRRPRIVSPVAGSVYALDPDIPADRQRMAITVSGATAGHRLVLDNQDLGTADSRPMLAAARGRHRLRLVDLSGRTVDQVIFTVR